MTVRMFAFAALGALTATSALAQSVGSQFRVPDLSGVYRCVRNCAGAGPAHITQRGWQLELINEVGEPSTAWIRQPGYMWVQSWNEGAVYSPDGFTIQFGNGTVWVLVDPTPAPGWRY